MKKNLNKIIALAIGISVMSGSVMPVFAVDTTQSTNVMQTQSNQKSVITLDEVVKSAVDNSDKLALKTNQITVYERKMDLEEYNKDYKEEIGENANNDTLDDFSYDNLELQQKQTEQSREFLKDQIANDITKKYNAIILKQMDIDKSKFDLETQTKNLDILKTKVAIGLATSNQLYDKQIEIKKAQDYIKAKEDSLKVSIEFLGVLSDLDLSKYTLDSNIEFNTFKLDGSIDEYVDDKVDKYLKYNDELVKFTDDYLKELKDESIKDLKNVIDGDVAESPDKNDSKYTVSDGAGGTQQDATAYSVDLLMYVRQQEKIINGYSSYLDARYNTDEAKVKLNDSKKNLKNSLKEMYASLTDLENQINSLKEQVQSTNTKIKYAKSQVDLGMMTQNDYKTQVLNSENLNYSLRNLIITYNNVKDSIEKPWILNNN
ncbi:hypothetical protein LF65_01648 [Clostridium beijerinckii]|uniref:Outer membrane efflux protein n=1 Tax=Clostridium beijerinckii TaxID=1520 RepID=A0A0B5QN62_CLOBE|nr:TolC family protein [Clostridium beijerinckii]AJG98253.1 hypothetical protein LF65_01648 [Clostridium beijerinckii]